MFDRPDKSLVLQGLASFLEEQVRPALSDKALSFRVLVAAHVARSVAFESQLGEEGMLAALQRLPALLPDEVPHEIPETMARRQDLVARAEGSLAERIREGEINAAPGSDAWEHCKQALADELAATNPRFDLSPHIE